jgi:hypothetical protein
MVILDMRLFFKLILRKTIQKLHIIITRSALSVSMVDAVHHPSTAYLYKCAFLYQFQGQ